jgi:hypothetical protein
MMNVVHADIGGKPAQDARQVIVRTAVQEPHHKNPNLRASPDHAPRQALSHLFRADARHRSDQLIGAIPLTMQRVWG